MEENLKVSIKNAIEHSGFPLEHYIYTILRKHEWSVITNRYYIDDIKGIEREIDIIAYKIHYDEVENIQYVTSLIISCKRSENKHWCFLTRDINDKDCNFDWTPLHFCTTDKRLEYMTTNHREIVIDSYKSNDKTRGIYDFSDNVFAYEQLRTPANNSEKEKKGDLVICGNDDIYNSITTTIKAVSYEKQSRLDKYRKHKCKRYYTFHILSIFDGSMIKDYIDSHGEHNIDNAYIVKYLNRHIVNNVDEHYIVNFISKSHFEEALQLFNNIHDENKLVLPSLLTLFYDEIFSDGKKVKMEWDNFSTWIVSTIKSILIDNNYIKSTEKVTLSYIYDKQESVLEIGVDLSFILPKEAVNYLNNNEQLMKYTKKKLEEIYRYKGHFVFTDGLPF